MCKFFNFSLVGTFLLLVIVMSSCDTNVNDATNLSGEIDISNLDSTEIPQLISAYKDSISENRFEERNGIYFKKIAKLYKAKEEYNQAAINYMWALQADPDIEGNKIIIHSLIKFAHKYMSDKVVSNMFKLAYAERYPDDPQSEKYRNSYAATDSLEVLIDVFKNNMSDSDKGIQSPISKKIVDGSEIYATILYDRDDAAEKIAEAALILQSRQAVNKALSFYDWIITKYPESKNAANALFMKAFVFDEEINDTARAHKYYQAFIDKYPEHELASDASILIEKLGKEFTPPGQ